MRIFKRVIKIVLAFVITISFVSYGFCGLVITENDGTKAFVSNGKIKSISDDPEEEQMIFKLQEGTITVLNHQEKTASQGTIDEYCSLMKKMSEVMNQGMRQMMEQMKEQGMSEMPSYLSDAGHTSVEEVVVKMVGSGGSVAGYDTEKYQVYADEKLYEEVWISKNEKLSKEIGNMEMLARFEACASQMMGDKTVEASSEYQKLIKSGWMLKSISYQDGDTETIVDVRMIEEKSIPDSEFEIPAGYEKISLSESFKRE